MRQGITRFFKYARARHGVYLNRMSGAPRPWSKDPIFEEHRFTNVFRELDKTTVWFREKVREPMRDKPEVLLATVLFRLLNRIEVGEAIFCQGILPLGRFKTVQGRYREYLTAWDVFYASGEVSELRRAIKNAIPNGPYCTGAYIISSPPGYAKLDGVLRVVKKFYDDSGWREWLNNDPASNECSLEAAWEFLKENDYFGPFHSYEIVTDLRHTALLCDAPDIMTWANPGPGARRGLNRVHGRDVKDKTVNRNGLIEEMGELLEYSKMPELWPQWNPGKVGGYFNADKESRNNGKPWPGPLGKDAWPAWEMREVEHTLCEFDKYERVRLGEGRPRGVYR